MTRQEAAAVHAAIVALTARAERAEAELARFQGSGVWIDRAKAEARYVERMRESS